MLSGGRLMRHELDGDQLGGFRLLSRGLSGRAEGTDLGFAGAEIIAADPGAVWDAALPYAGPGSLCRVGGNLGTRRPEYRAIARSASRRLSRTLGI